MSTKVSPGRVLRSFVSPLLSHPPPVISVVNHSLPPVSNHLPPLFPDTRVNGKGPFTEERTTLSFCLYFRGCLSTLTSQNCTVSVLYLFKESRRIEEILQPSLQTSHSVHLRSIVHNSPVFSLTMTLDVSPTRIKSPYTVPHSRLNTDC